MTTLAKRHTQTLVETFKTIIGKVDMNPANFVEAVKDNKRALTHCSGSQWIALVMNSLVLR